MLVIKFSVYNQRLRRITSGIISSSAYGKLKFEFDFRTEDWNNSATKTAVFSCGGENYVRTLDENNMCEVPKEAFEYSYFVVSVHDDQNFLTNSVRVPVIHNRGGSTPGGSGSCDCGPNIVYVPEIDNDKILSWTIKEATDGMPVPNPVDLNINDDWIEDETLSEYEWEEDV